jgi:hypothetical protein
MGDHKMSRTFQAFRLNRGTVVDVLFDAHSLLEIEIIEAVDVFGQPVAFGPGDYLRCEGFILDMLAEEADPDAFSSEYEDPYRPNSLAGDL